LILLSQLDRPLGPLGLQTVVKLTPAVIGGLRQLQCPADVDDDSALGDQLLGRFKITNDLLGSVAGSLHGGLPGSVRPYEVSNTV